MIGMAHIVKNLGRHATIYIVKITEYALIQDMKNGHQTNGNAHAQKDIREKNVQLTRVLPFHLLWWLVSELELLLFQDQHVLFFGQDLNKLKQHEIKENIEY